MRKTSDSDLETFGTEDPDTIRSLFKSSYEARLKVESTFGGYLKSLRRRLGRTVNEMAGKASVPPPDWADWEANINLPDAQTVFDIMDRLYYGREEAQNLLDLLVESPRHFIRDLSLLCLEKLVADGPQMLDVDRLWKSFPIDARKPLLVWAKTAGRCFPEELLEVLGELSGEDERENWVLQVLGDADAR